MSNIDPQRWRRLRALLDSAMDYDGAARLAFVDALQGEDAELREDLQRLLIQHARDEEEISIDPYALAAPLILAATATNAEEDRIGQQIGVYRLVRLIGSGGMGSVYLAQRNTDNFVQCVALKVIRGEVATAAVRERFERERQILARLVHPHIAPLYDGGQTAEGQPFYTMEYVDGVPITEYCAEHLSDVRSRVRLLIDIASALACAHQNLVVHRDIKPSNILVTAQGRAKLLDFGIAKPMGASDVALTHAALGPMTPEYAAPEQFRNADVTVATDIYQFGVLCFRVLTGRLPYRADPTDTYAWSRAVAEDEPLTLRRAITLDGLHTAPSSGGKTQRTRHQLSDDLDAIVRKALAKLPAQRYGSMDAMSTDLQAFIDGRPVSARSAGPLYFAWRAITRWPYVSAAALSAILALIGLVLIAHQQTNIARHEATRANAVAKFLIDMFQVADPAVNRGERLNANEILARGAARIDHDFADDTSQRAALQKVIGEVYSSLGDFPRARVPLEGAVKSWRETDSRFELAQSLRSLGYVDYRQGHIPAALHGIDEAIALLTGNGTRDYEELAQLHSYRALVLQASADNIRALDEFKTAYAFAELAGVATKVRGASIQNNLGLLMRDLSDLPAAEIALRKALEIYRHEFGDDHFRTISTTQNLGLILLDLNRLDEAQVLTDGASERIRVLYGDANADYATAMNTRGSVARRRGDGVHALEIYAKSEAAFRASLGDKHWYVSWPIFNSGLVFLDQHNDAAALQKFEVALRLRRAALAADHPAVAEALQGRSEALFGLMRYDEALLDAQQALTILRSKVGHDHPALIRGLWLVGHVEYLRGDAASAKIYWDEALDGATRAFAKDSDDLVRLRRNIANPQSRVRDLAD
jgi:serine/threonine protein kinase